MTLWRTEWFLSPGDRVRLTTAALAHADVNGVRITPELTPGKVHTVTETCGMLATLDNGVKVNAAWLEKEVNE